MSESRENSVLFSLKELRRIEDDRVRKEQEDARARAEADRAAKEAAVRRAREEEEQRRRDEEERLRRIEEDKAAKLREEQLRLQESENRHRVDGELRLQEERMRLELQARKSSSPIKAVVTVSLVLVAIAGGLGWKMYSQHQAEMAFAAAERARLEASNQAAQVEFEKKMAAIQKDMNDKLQREHDAVKQQRIRDEAAAEQQRAEAVRQEAARRVPSHKADKDETKPLRPHFEKKKVSDDPLEGLKL
jgi:hypothetical protein